MEIEEYHSTQDSISVLVHWCIVALLHWCINEWVYLCIGAIMHCCINALEQFIFFYDPTILSQILSNPSKIAIEYSKYPQLLLTYHEE